MHKQVLAYLCIVLVMINACGRNEMTEGSAIDTLADLPMSSGTMASSFDESTEVTYDNLGALVQNLVDSNQVQLRGAARMAVSSNNKVDLATLNQLLTFLKSQSGSKPNALKLASGLLAMNTAAGDTGSKLESILALITQLAPLISAIAPQFAPIIAAITTLVPLVIQIINLFKKPSASYDGAFRPVTA